MISDEKSKVIEIISDYDIKMKENVDMPVSYEHEIKLIDDNLVSSPARRLPNSQRDEIDKQVNDSLEKNYIAPSRSAYASPIVPVLKKDGSIRMCVDYRKLNKKTVKCNYPVAAFEDLLEGVSGCDNFSVIDLRQAYHHIPIKVEHREKTAFVVGASFSLSAAMVEILSDYRSFVRAYYDDCIIASRGREQHLQHLEKIFQKFSCYCLHINLLKSQIMKRSVIFLGHIVSDKGIFPEASKVDEVVNFFTKENRKSKSKLFMENDLLIYYHRNCLVICPSGSSICLTHSGARLIVCSAHLAFLRLKLALASFWWPGLYSDIVDFITQCEVCISVKPSNRNPGRMGIRSFPSSPMELVSIVFLVTCPLRIVGIVAY